MIVQVSIVALKENQIRIVQSSMLGSILSNILLVLGCCFFFGGLRYHVQEFNETVASTMSSLMAVASASLVIPATLYAVMAANKVTDSKDSDANILVLSHGTAIILLILYVLYLYFQLKTHKELFDEEEQHGDGDEESEEEQILSPWAAGVALVVVTIMVAVCAEFLVDSIDSIVETMHISKTFIGLILLPIVGNAAEHVTAVVVSMKNKMDLAIGVAIGSSMQIALLVTPFLVILGWILDKEMTLHFETFETVVFFLSVLVVNCESERDRKASMFVIADRASRPDPRREVELPRRCYVDWSVCHTKDRVSTAQVLTIIQVHHHCPRLLRLPRFRFLQGA